MIRRRATGCSACSSRSSSSRLLLSGFRLRSQTELVASWGILVSDGEREALAAAAASNTFESVPACGHEDILPRTHGRDRLASATYSTLDDLMSAGDPMPPLQPRSVQHLHQGDHRAQLRRHRWCSLTTTGAPTSDV
ncbi:MAG: hypothetical protein ACLUW6_05435 [Coriobacteriaceae bacterium]